jgi:subtilisin family serine protease
MTKLVLVAVLAVFVAFPADASAGQVIVKYRKGASVGKRIAAVRRVGDAREVGRVRGQGTRVLAVAGDSVQAAAQLDGEPGVAWAEPDYRLRAVVAPNDPLLDQLGGLGLMHARAGWDTVGIGATFPPDGGVPVAIVDTGIDSSHEDLIGKASRCATSRGGVVTEGACEDDNDHGTHVAGTVGAVAGNGVGIAGVAFNSPLVVCKALSGDGSGETSDVAACISWAHSRGAKVISMSLGGPASRTLSAAVRAAWEGGGRGGSVLVAAAGNDGDAEEDYPAAYADVVSVAAVDDRGEHAEFSNANDDVEVAAPGVDVLSAARGGGYVRLSGTSMATPHAAGAAALLWDLHRRSAASTIRRRLDDLAADAGAPGRDPWFGFGILDLARMTP